MNAPPSWPSPTALCSNKSASASARRTIARRSESKFRALIENAQDLTSLATPEGVILYLSPSAEHILGYVPDDMIGRDAFAHTIHPDDAHVADDEFDLGG